MIKKYWKTPIRVIVFSECNQWVAQGLEHDVCVQAADLDSLLSRMEAAIYAEHIAQIEAGKDGISSIHPAPERFFLMWDK